MMKIALLTAVFAFSLRLSGSASIDEPLLEEFERENEVAGRRDKRQNQDREFQTYNVGLLNTVQNNRDRTTRRDDIVQTIQGSSADVLCLQEVWYENDMRHIVDAVSDTFEFSHSFIHRDGQIPVDTEPQNVCAVGSNQIQDLTNCITNNCAADPSTYLQCLFSSCHPLMFLSQRCLECAVFSCLSALTDLTAATACVETNLRAGLCHSPINGGHEMRTRGLLLLSKREIQNPKSVSFPYRSRDNFDKIINGRGYLRAEIEDTTVVCTHLTSTSNSPFFDYATGFIQNKGMNAHETTELFNRLSPSIDGSIIYLGDFNFGPAANNVVAELPARYTKVMRTGYESALVLVDKPHCTLCSMNSYVTEDQTGINAMIDHIFVKRTGQFSVTDAKLLENTMDKESDPVCDDISDHYGVSATIRGPFSNQYKRVV